MSMRSAMYTRPLAYAAWQGARAGGWVEWGIWVGRRPRNTHPEACLRIHQPCPQHGAPPLVPYPNPHRDPRPCPPTQPPPPPSIGPTHPATPVAARVDRTRIKVGCVDHRLLVLRQIHGGADESLLAGLQRGWVRGRADGLETCVSGGSAGRTPWLASSRPPSAPRRPASWGWARATWRPAERRGRRGRAAPESAALTVVAPAPHLAPVDKAPHEERRRRAKAVVVPQRACRDQCGEDEHAPRRQLV